MSGRLAFYEQAVALTPERHAGWCIDPEAGFAYSRHSMAVPLVAAEFARAAACYPVVFVGADGGKVPVALLGLSEGQNLFITAEGLWDAPYVPAFVRRYPFVFATDAKGERFTLCIDEAFAGCNTEGIGEPLFADGAPSAYLERVLAFLSEYQRNFRATANMIERLEESGVFEPMRADVRSAGGANSSLGGFMVIDRERLYGLQDERLASLARDGVLECVALHHVSLERFEDLAARRAATAKDSALGG